MTTEQYITELQNITLNAINALRITGCADKLADSLSEKLEEFAEPPKQTDGKIAIFVDGGIVQGIRSNIAENIDVEIVDADNDPNDADDRWEELQTELPFGNY
jgi:hypothetical protein